MSDAKPAKVELIVQKPVAKAILTQMDKHPEYYFTKRDLRDAYRITGINPVFTNMRAKGPDKLEYRVTFETKENETLKTLMEYIFKTLVNFSAKEEESTQ